MSLLGMQRNFEFGARNDDAVVDAVALEAVEDLFELGRLLTRALCSDQKSQHEVCEFAVIPDGPCTESCLLTSFLSYLSVNNTG